MLLCHLKVILDFHIYAHTILKFVVIIKRIFAKINQNGMNIVGFCMIYV